MPLVSYEENIRHMRGLQKWSAEKVLMPNLYPLWACWLFLADRLAIIIRSNWWLSLFIITFGMARFIIWFIPMLCPIITHEWKYSNSSTAVFDDTAVPNPFYLFVRTTLMESAKNSVISHLNKGFVLYYCNFKQVWYVWKDVIPNCTFQLYLRNYW